jgi:mRNA interferase MazF
VISAEAYLDVVHTLVLVVPVSRTDRGWPNHVRLTGTVGLPEGLAMTEQPRTISRDRLDQRAGRVDDRCLTEVRTRLADFLDLRPG